MSGNIVALQGLIAPVCLSFFIAYNVQQIKHSTNPVSVERQVISAQARQTTRKIGAKKLENFHNFAQKVEVNVRIFMVFIKHSLQISLGFLRVAVESKTY